MLFYIALLTLVIIILYIFDYRSDELQIRAADEGCRKT